MITCKILEDVLEGDFEECVEQMVKHGKEDPGWMLNLMLNLSRKLRERTELPRTARTTSARTRSGTIPANKISGDCKIFFPRAGLCSFQMV